MKAIVYSYEKMARAGELINLLKISGISNIRIIAELADILDSGKIGDYEEENQGSNLKESGENDAVEHKEVQ